MHGYRLGSNVFFAEPPQSNVGTLGNALSVAAGQSLEFRDHREYLPGDDLRRIDWNAYARSDKLTVKLYRNEIHPTVDLLLDVSKSMNLHGTRKGEAVYTLAGYFASAAASSHFSFRVFTTQRACPQLDRSDRLPTDWQPFELTATESPAEMLNRLPPAWRKHGIRIVVSDFLFPAEPEPFVARVANEAAETVLIQLLAENDVVPPDFGNLRLTDCESGERLDLFLDRATQERYQKNLAAHQEHYHTAARRHGAVFCTVVAERFLETGRLDDALYRDVLRVK
jgi:uncharacterized protein (DUF58 family)